MSYLSAVTKSLQRSARCPKRGDQRRRPIPAPLRSAPTKRGAVTLVIPMLHYFVYRKNSWRKPKYSQSFCRSYDPQLLCICAPSCVPQQAVYQAERVQRRQAQHLPFFIQHQQLQQHDGRNRGSGRTGDREYNSHS